MSISRLTIKGQITVPKGMRDSFGWKPHTELQFELLPDGVKISRAPELRSKGLRIVRRLRGKGNRKWTTDQIMRITRGDEE